MQEKIFTKRFISLCLTNIAVFFIFYGLVTTIPLYASGKLGRTDEEAGLLITVFLIAAIVIRPFCGKILDVAGKKRMLIISLIIFMLCTVLYVFVTPFVLLLALRFFQGLWFSIITTATGSLAADIVPANRKGAGMGYYSMSSGLAIVLGPFIGLLLVQHTSYTTLFLVMSAVAFIGALIALTLKVDDLPKPQQVKRGFTLDDLIEKKALLIAIIAALVAFSYASVLSFLGLFAEQKDLLTEASYFYAVFAIAMLLTRPYVGKIFDQYGAKYVIIPAFILFIIGLFLLANTNGAIAFMLVAVCIGIGYGTLTTSLQTSAVKKAIPSRSAYATATYLMFFDFGLAIGSYVLGFVGSSLGYIAVYYIAAVFLILVLGLYVLLVKKNKIA